MHGTTFSIPFYATLVGTGVTWTTISILSGKAQTWLFWALTHDDFHLWCLNTRKAWFSSLMSESETFGTCTKLSWDFDFLHLGRSHHASIRLDIFSEYQMDDCALLWCHIENRKLKFDSKIIRNKWFQINTPHMWDSIWNGWDIIIPYLTHAGD